MARTPYGLIGGGQTLYESMARAQQAGETSRGATTAQMGAMGKEFEEKIQEAERKAQEELQKRARHRKKRKWYQKALGSIAPALFGMIPGVGAIGAGLISGLAKGRDVYRKGKKDIDFARQQAREAKKASLSVDPRFGKMFTSKGLTRYTGGAEQKYGNILRQAERMDKSDVLNQALFSGLTTGISSYGGGKLGGNIGDAWREAAAARGPGKFMSKFGTGEGTLSELFGKQAVTTDGVTEEGKSRIMKAFTGAGLDMKTLLGEKGQIGQSLPLLMMLLQQFRGGE